MSPAAVIAVRVTPRSSRDAVERVDEAGELRVRVTAPPTDGAANAAVARLLARTLGLPKGAVSLVSGASSRHKRLEIAGAGAAELRRRWPGLSVRER
ncbi:MAG: DUF167 domain-containing protein [Candidatus Limnocylindrales bacterium]